MSSSSGTGPEPELVPATLVVATPTATPVGGLVIPPEAQLVLLREQAKAAGTLKDLRRMVAAWEAVAERCDLAYEELHRLAVFRLEVERDLGRELAQVVKRGGDRRKLPRGTLGRVGNVPEGISRKQSMVYQKLVAVPESVFRDYVEACRSRRAVPSSRGTLLYGRQAGGEHPRRRSPRAKTPPLELPQAVVDAVARCMDVDVLVGEAKIQARVRLRPDAKDAFARLYGNVFVTACANPALWVRTLQALRDRAQIDQSILVIAAYVWEKWFGELLSTASTICFLRTHRSADGSGMLLIHLGQKPAGFRAVAREIGAVTG